MRLQSITQILNPYWILNLTKFAPWPGNFPLPQFQAHRGYWVEGGRENSLEAFRKAKQLGFQMCELDVQITKDLIAVVYHDRNLKRFHGINKKISKMTLAEFKKITNAPTLKEVLSDSSLTDYFNIEIKSLYLIEDPLVTVVSQVIMETKAENRVLISSFNPWCLIKLKSILPQVPRALLVTQESAQWNLMYLKKMWTAPLVEPHILHLDHQMLDDKTLTRMIQKETPLAVWTVNDKARADELLNAGVWSIITDRCKPY